MLPIGVQISSSQKRDLEVRWSSKACYLTVNLCGVFSQRGITRLSRFVNATSSSLRVILKTRLFIRLPPNNPPFLCICAPTTSLVSPILVDQHRSSIFGSSLIMSCRVLCLGQGVLRFLFHFATFSDQFTVLDYC